MATLGIDLLLLSAAPILPFLLLIILIDFKKNRWWLILAGAAFIALSGGFVFAVFLPWIYHQIDWKIYFKSFYRFVLMFLIGGTIGLIQFLPVAIFIPFSLREGGMDYASAIGEPVKLLDLISFLFPNFGIQREENKDNYNFIIGNAMWAVFIIIAPDVSE